MNNAILLACIVALKTGKIKASKSKDLVKVMTNSDPNLALSTLEPESKPEIDILNKISPLLSKIELRFEPEGLYDHYNSLKSSLISINTEKNLCEFQSEEFKKLDKLEKKKEKETNLLENLLINKGIVKPQFHIWGTLSGRIITYSPSTQNFPEYFKGYLLTLNPEDNIYELDIISAEVLALAHLSQENKIFQLFKNGSDIYIYVATQLFDLNSDDITPEIRKISKKIVNGFNLGMGAHTLTEMLYKSGYIASLDINIAKQLKNKYFSLFPDIKAFQDKLKEATELTTYFGHKFNVKPSYKHIAFPAQNLIASLLKLIIIDLDTAGLWKHSLNIVHDSIWISCNEKTMLKIKQIMENRLSEILPEEFKTLPNFEAIKTTLLKKGGE
ncbi:MAG: DNA polymerase [Cetobacterium sp.]|uniref:DNA polymerase n=1 Tax=Cetobacterium sp. TaxID=2071632 RepID=UPI003EE6CCD7